MSDGSLLFKYNKTIDSSQVMFLKRDHKNFNIFKKKQKTKINIKNLFNNKTKYLN